MNKPYKVVNALTTEQVDDLLTTMRSQEAKPAMVSEPGGVNEWYNSSVRSCTNAWIYPEEIDLDIHLDLLSLVDNSSLYFIEEWHYLKYIKGDHFIRHSDNGAEPGNPRKWTMITLLNKSDDLVGGDLFVYINDQKERVNIEIGQTVVLPSDLDHEVSIVETGEREVLINWLRFRN